MLTDTTTIQAAEHQVTSTLSGEAVILDLEGGTYYGLNTVGATIWSLLQTPTTVAALREALLEEYDVSFEQCDREVKRLLHELNAHGLITIQTTA